MKLFLRLVAAGRAVILAALLALPAAEPAFARSVGNVPTAAAASILPATFASQAPLDTVTAELQLADMINALRASHGQPALELDAALTELARIRSQDMVERQYFSHDIPGVGFAPLWLLDQLPEAMGAGENLGLSDAPNDQVVQALFDAWVASPSHLENMLRPQFNRIGVGVIETPGRPGVTVKVVTQVFAIAPGPLTRRAA